MPFHSPFLSKHCPEHGAKGCQDRYTFADTLNACVNEWTLKSQCALWVTDIRTWAARDCLRACHSWLQCAANTSSPRTVWVSWFHRQQWLLTDYLFVLSHELCFAAWTQRCTDSALLFRDASLSSFLHRFSLHWLLAPCCWRPAERSGQKPSMATHYMHGNSARRQRQKEQTAHSSLGHCHKARNSSPFPRTSPYVRSN